MLRSHGPCYTCMICMCHACAFPRCLWLCNTHVHKEPLERVYGSDSCKPADKPNLHVPCLPFAGTTGLTARVRAARFCVKQADHKALQCKHASTAPSTRKWQASKACKVYEVARQQHACPQERRNTEKWKATCRWAACATAHPKRWPMLQSMAPQLQHRNSPCASSTEFTVKHDA